MNRLICSACVALAAATSLSAQEPRLQATLDGHSGRVESVAFSPNSKSIVVSCDPIKLWDVTSGKIIATFEPNGSAMSVAFSPDGKTVASATYCGGVVDLWDVAAGKNNARHHVVAAAGDDAPFGELTGEKIAVVFSPDGKTLAATANDREAIRLWDVATGKVIATMKLRDCDLPLAYAPDGKTLASGYRPSGIALWDVAARKTTAVLRGHADHVTSVAFSPDGKTLVSGSLDRTIAIWSLATGKITATLKGHAAAVGCIAFSPDGKTLASGSSDKTIRLWDLASGRTTATLKGHSDAVSSVAFSPDGRTLASGSSDKTLKLWDLKPGAGPVRPRAPIRPAAPPSDPVAELNAQIERFNKDRPSQKGISPIERHVVRVEYVQGQDVVRCYDGKGEVFLTLKRQHDGPFVGIIEVQFHEPANRERHAWGHVLATFSLPNEAFKQAPPPSK